MQEFDFLMIKPSHYDDDGYPIVWWKTLIPSNSLAALNGLARDCAARNVLGEDVRINLITIDETNTHVRPEKIIRDIRRRGARVLVGLVGVQSNQFDRAMDLARPFRAAGFPVMIGGFHVSGSLSMLKETPPEMREAMELGISIFAGECEERRLDEVLIDAWRGELKPVYNYLKDLPTLAGQPTPVLPADAIKRNSQNWSSFDLGRGCPFQCSFCTIINVQGRKSRFRTPDDLEAIVRENFAQGIRTFFVTDDNLARNKHWEAFFDRLILIAETEGLTANLTIQVDTLCHKIPGFIEKAVRAGVKRVFIGLENINPDNLLAANKRQNKITEYREMILEWHDRGACTFAGYILGFPGDTRASILRDIEIIKRELPLDVLEFFMLTPLPGSEDHRRLLDKGEWMDPDLNKYNLHHRVTHHPKMSDEEWDSAYRDAWSAFFTYEHMETVARRHAANPQGRPKKALQYMNEFKMLYEVEGLHALEGGILRRKRRRARRSTLKREPALVFYSRYVFGTLLKGFRYWRGFQAEKAILRRVMSDPNRTAYSDAAMQRPNADELDTYELYQETSGGTAAVTKKLNQDALLARTGVRATAGT
jgi:hypothetical protein